MKKLVSIIAIGLIVLIGLGFTIRETIFPIKDKKVIEQYSKEYKVKPELVAAVINFETGFNKIPYEEGKSCGLMKLTGETGEKLAKEIGDKGFKKDEIANDDINIKFGTYYLSKSNGQSLENLVGNWAVRNGEEKESGFDAKEYAKKYYTSKIENREKIYKVLYFLF